MRLILRSEKLIPFLQYQRLVCFNDSSDLPQIMRSETMIDRQPRGRQPEFGIKTAFCNVNVRRLIAFFSVEAVAQQTQGLRPRIGAHQGPSFVMSIGIMIPQADHRDGHGSRRPTPKAPDPAILAMGVALLGG